MGNKTDDIELILVNQLKNAYRKYKTHVYYDNHSAIQREKLANFEALHFCDYGNYEESFFNKSYSDEVFIKLANMIINNDLSKFTQNINVMAFPKKMKNEDSDVISNFKESSKTIEQIHYFIDLPVEAHILGVLWILRCGYVLDDKLYKNCYGNRLNRHLLDSLKENYNETCTKDFSPFLFEPYYKKYQSWRDNALNNVKNLMKHEKDAIMISLDFKNYYYSSLIDFDAMKKDISHAKERINKLFYGENFDSFKDIDETLTVFIQDVFNKYFKKFNVSNYFYDENDEPYPFIPLGFLPSLIIANWNLQAFDQAILEDVHPSYYGRYVDDILIVLDSHEKSESHGNPPFQEMSAADVIKKYFTGADENNPPLNNIFYADDEVTQSSNEYSDNEEKIIYHVNNLKNREINDIEYHYENLQIQSQKVKLYTFSYKNSTAIIDNFKKEIIKNSSEFKLMNDSDKLFAEFENKLFEIDYAESINKLNNINSVKINKFEISKLLSGILQASVFSSQNIDDEIIGKVIEAFNSNIFEFFILWEKLFSLLYMNCNDVELVNIINQIYNQVDDLEYEPEKATFIYTIENNLNILKDSLKSFIKSTITRVLSLKSTDLFKELSFYEINDTTYVHPYLQSSFNFIFSSMINNSLMKFPLQNTFRVQNLIKTNWGTKNNFEDISYDLMKNNESENESLFKGFCFPRYIKLHEVQLNYLYNNIFKNGEKNQFEEKLKDSIDLHSKLNFYEHQNSKICSNIHKVLHLGCKYNCNETSDCPVNDIYKTITIGNNDKNELKIGLINTKLNNQDFISRLDGKPNLKMDRFNKIKILINKAVENDVELLLMPEMYIPYEWINEIINMSKMHQMAIIFGLEPIIHENIVYNFIMGTMPFEYENSYYETMVSCRLKNHYSPEESQYIQLKHLKEPEEKNKYYLYSWNGIHIVPYYCYEIADIHNRSNFKSCCDIVTISEFNKDAIYFSNIAESLTRDLYCYCIKCNTSEFGGTGIICPASSEYKKIVDLKGGENDYLVIQQIDVGKIRRNALHSDSISHKKDKILKPNPPGINKDIIKERMNLPNKYSKKQEFIPHQLIENNVLRKVKQEFGEDLSEYTIGIWGLSLKSNTKNIVSAPSLRIVKELFNFGAKIKVYDSSTVMKSFKEIMGIDDIEYFENKYDVLYDIDMLIILNDKNEFKVLDKYEMEKRMNKNMIFDTKNVIPKDIEKFLIYRINKI